MVYVLIVAAVIVGGVGLLVILDQFPAKYRNLDTPRVRALLELLYVRGTDQGFLQFKGKRYRDGFRVYKVVRSIDDVVFAFDLPDETRRAVAHEKLLQLFELHGCTAVEPGKSSESRIAICPPIVPQLVAVTEAVIRDGLDEDPEKGWVAWVEKTAPDTSAHPGFSSRPKIPGSGLYG